MEDAHILNGDIPELPECCLFAVFDGHGGSLVAKMSEEKLLSAILRTPEFLASDGKDPETLKMALYAGFFLLDTELREIPKLASGEDMSGSTATSALVTPTHVILANVGDSRSMFVSGGEIIISTDDHKPSNEKESKRIYEAGGHVQIGRVNGNLAVSRALGDFVYKDTPHLPAHAQKVSVEADLHVVPRSEKDEFLILACDGVWDVMSCVNVRDFVRDHLKAGVPVPVICEEIIDFCLKRDSKDNMTFNLCVFPGAPTKVEGFTLPSFSNYMPAPVVSAQDDSSGPPPMRNVMDLLEMLRARGVNLEPADSEDAEHEGIAKDDEPKSEAPEEPPK